LNITGTMLYRNLGTRGIRMFGDARDPISGNPEAGRFRAGRIAPRVRLCLFAAAILLSSLSLSAGPASANWAWEEVSPSTYPDLGYAESYNGSIYMIGDWIQVYVPVTDNWTVRGSTGLPWVAYRGGSTIVGDRIYIVDGFIDAQYYNITTDTFIDMVDPPTDRLDFEVAQSGGIIYVLGGWIDGINISINIVEAYNPANDTWWAVAPMLVGRRNAQAVGLDGHIYAIGGFTGLGWATPVNSVERYDPATNAWTLVSSMNDNFFKCGATAHKGKIVVAGGSAYKAFSEVYFPGSDFWVDGPPIPFDNYLDNEMASVGDYVYSVGGRTAPSVLYNKTLRWEVDIPPIAVIAVTPSTTGFIGSVFTFDGSGSSDTDGSVVSWRWDFGDGDTALGVNVVHSYAAKQTFTVTLNVTDDLGAWDETTVQILIMNRAPTIISASPNSALVSLVAGTTQTFAAVADDPDGDVLTYTWRVDGVSEGDNSRFHDFSREGVGTYRVNVTVSDGSAQVWREWSAEVTSRPPPPLDGVMWLIPAIIILMLVAFAIILFVLWRRRRKSEGVTQESSGKKENGA